MNKIVNNPILPGFNPDPYIFTDGQKYYIAVSTFEWVPGVRVYASTDLVHWEYETSILQEKQTAAFEGNPDNCSVWAPSMAYYDNTYWLIFTDVKAFWAPFSDQRNYIITAPDIHGPWSKPTYINSAGFDPSLFFEDGRMYVVNEIWDWRKPTKNKSIGIEIQEYDRDIFSPVGQASMIFSGTSARMTEAPQIYKHDGYYYLLTAEGGTGLGHQVTVARSKTLMGTYIPDPVGPMLTSRLNPKLYLQCAGHASLVTTPEGKTYMVHLATRPLKGNYPVLGRETAIQNVKWTSDGWLRLDGGDIEPKNTAEINVEDIARDICDTTESSSFSSNFAHGFSDNFSGHELNYARWNTLRSLPDKSWLEFTEYGLKIRGGASPRSGFYQHLIGTRQTDFAFSASVEMHFCPKTYQQLAGMLLYLNTGRFVFLAVTYDDRINSVQAQLIGVESGNPLNFRCAPVKLDGDDFQLRIEVNRDKASFFICDKAGEHIVARNIDITFLSGGFTGCFVALDVVDLNRHNDAEAIFSHFMYEPDNTVDSGWVSAK